MKTLGYVIVHYGLPYFDAALASLSPQVDKLIILYTPNPSQGHRTHKRCPDSRDELYAVAAKYPNIQWMDGNWGDEGSHCGAVMPQTLGFDWLVRLDTDEVIHPGTVSRWVQHASTRPAKHYSPKFFHFWRSFGRACQDGHQPVRLTNLGGGSGLEGLPAELGAVYHFGYAQPTRYIDYKLEVQGHKSEFRPEWYREKWKVNAQEDVHIVCKYGFWKPEPFDRATLPEVLKGHPYYGLEVIE